MSEMIKTRGSQTITDLIIKISDDPDEPLRGTYARQQLTNEVIENPAPNADARSSPCQQLKSSTKALMMCTMVEIIEMIEIIQVVEMLEIIEKDAPGFPARPKRPTLHMHTNAI